MSGCHAAAYCANEHREKLLRGFKRFRGGCCDGGRRLARSGGSGGGGHAAVAIWLPRSTSAALAASRERPRGENGATSAMQCSRRQRLDQLLVKPKAKSRGRKKLAETILSRMSAANRNLPD